MELIFNGDVELNERANDSMSLLTMLDTYLYKGKVSVSSIRFKPYLIDNCKSGLFGLNAIYHDNKEFILEIIEIFFYDHLFMPSEIRKKGSEEYFLFVTLMAIQNIVWFNKIENSRERGYEKELERIEKAKSVLYAWVNDSKCLDSLVECPPHRNETIIALEIFFKDNRRIQQGDRIIKIIKEYFKIERVTATKNIHMKNANKRIIINLEKKGHNQNEINIMRKILGVRS